MHILNCIAEEGAFVRADVVKEGWLALLCQMLKAEDIKTADAAFETLRRIYTTYNMEEVVKNNGI